MNSFIEFVKGVVFRSRYLTRALRQCRLLLHMLRRTPHEPDFLFLSDAHFRNGLLLDLGANIGQSAISALKAQPSLRVLSIEANPACASALGLAKLILGKRFEFRLIGVGCGADSLEFFVPMRSSRLLLEEGTFDCSTLQSPATRRRIGCEGIDFEMHRIQVPVIAVDSLQIAPVAIKMDLQGFELTALKGMVDTIRRCEPFIMIENGEELETIAEFLKEYGYEMTCWDGTKLRKTSGSPSSLNVIFVPRHRRSSEAMPEALLREA